MSTVFASFATFGQRCSSAIDLLRAEGHEVIVSEQEVNYDLSKESPEMLKKVDALIAGTSIWDAKAFDLMPNLKVIDRFGVGVELIDLEEARRRGIMVMNAKGGNARSVAEFALGLTLDALRNTPNLCAELKKGTWVRASGRDLSGMTVGLIGFGDIAKHFAKMLSGFDVRILACRRRTGVDEEVAKYGVTMVSEDELLAQSDIISLHIPATESNYHFINDERIEKMKNGVYLINTARGALIDDEALLRGIESGKIARAALDVFHEEPISADHILLNNENVICTPHTAADTVECAANVGLTVARDIAAALRGEKPATWLNP